MARGMGFRSDIEGLRAVAILLVVFAHAHVPGFPGGFVGVDVFFVLSGYLITGLLLKEASQSGSIDFASFYARRFRRLMPALMVMLLVVCGTAALALSAQAQIDQASAAAAAALWLSNMHFSLSSVGYFAADAEQNLFLHTWSLGVEEQFYLVWPALVLFAGSATHPRRLRLVMGAVLAGSLAACVWLTTAEPNFAFYSMPTRAWQFAGGALALLGVQRVRLSPTTARLAGWAGLGLILWSAITLTPASPYPGWRALVPSVGTALILVAGALRPTEGVGKPLSTYPMQWIGRVSYSWYLWHWPVLLLGDALIPMADGPRRALMVAASFAIACLSYRYVETPFQNNSRILRRPRRLIAVTAAAMAVLVAGTVAWHGRATALDASEVRFTASKQSAVYRLGCDDWIHSGDVKVCAFGPANAHHTAVLMGDSVGAQWFPAIERIYAQHGWRLLVITKSSCPMVDEPFFYPRIRREYTECSTWRRAALDRITAISPDVLILGSTDNYGFTPDQWTEGTSRLLGVVATHAKQIVILRATPALPFEPATCLQAARRFGIVDTVACTAPAASRQSEEVVQSIVAAASRFHNVRIVDMNGAVCPGNECRASVGGHQIYRDTRHLEVEFVESLTAALARRLEQEQ